MDFGIFIVIGISGIASFFYLAKLLDASRQGSPQRGKLLIKTCGVTLIFFMSCNGVRRLDLDETLWSEARAGHYERVQELLKQGASPEARFESGNTALQEAEESHDTRMVKILKDAGAKR